MESILIYNFIESMQIYCTQIQKLKLLLEVINYSFKNNKFKLDVESFID